MKIDAIVLSGRHRNPVRTLGHPTKSMIQYDGLTTLDRVLGEVVESTAIHSTVVIGPDEIHPLVEKWNRDSKPVFWVGNPRGYSMFHNLVHAYRHLLRCTDSLGDREIFYTCSDIPFLTADIISDFVNRFAGSQFTAVVPLVTLSSCRRLERGVGMEIPSVEDHLPIALDGELYHLGNMGLLQPGKITGYWFEALYLSRDSRDIISAPRALVDPKRIRLLFHLLMGFFAQKKGKEAHHFLRFTGQLLSWVASSHYFKHGKEKKARDYASRVDSHFLFREFFPGFGLDVTLVPYDRPEIFIDFDTLADVDFLNRCYSQLKSYFDSDSATGDG